MDAPTEASVMRYLGPEVGEDAPAVVAIDTRPRRVCISRNVVLDFHVWDEPRVRCTRCGFTRAEAAR